MIFVHTHPTLRLKCHENHKLRADFISLSCQSLSNEGGGAKKQGQDYKDRTRVNVTKEIEYVTACWNYVWLMSCLISILCTTLFQYFKDGAEFSSMKTIWAEWINELAGFHRNNVNIKHVQSGIFEIFTRNCLLNYIKKQNCRIDLYLSLFNTNDTINYWQQS